MAQYYQLLRTVEGEIVFSLYSPEKSCMEPQFTADSIIEEKVLGMTTFLVFEKMNHDRNRNEYIICWQKQYEWGILENCQEYFICNRNVYYQKNDKWSLWSKNPRKTSSYSLGKEIFCNIEHVHVFTLKEKESFIISYINKGNIAFDKYSDYTIEQDISPLEVKGGKFYGDILTLNKEGELIFVSVYVAKNFINGSLQDGSTFFFSDTAGQIPDRLIKQ